MTCVLLYLRLSKAAGVCVFGAERLVVIILWCGTIRHCADSLFGVRSTPVLPQWHVKDPGHSAKGAGGGLHLNAHTPLIQ